MVALILLDVFLISKYLTRCWFLPLTRKSFASRYKTLDHEFSEGKIKVFDESKKITINFFCRVITKLSKIGCI